MRGLVLFLIVSIVLGGALPGAEAQTRSLTQTDADTEVGLPEPTLEARVIESLRNSGYVRIQSKGTLLGRVRITGLQAGTLREIVLNPHTREILRDVEFQADGSAGLGHGTRQGGSLNAN